jgi:hypothetical protein
MQPTTARLHLSLFTRDRLSASTSTVNVRPHDLVEVCLVDHSASFGTFGFLLKVLAKTVKVKFALFDFGAGLKTIPGKVLAGCSETTMVYIYQIV